MSESSKKSRGRLFLWAVPVACIGCALATFALTGKSPVAPLPTATRAITTPTEVPLPTVTLEPHAAFQAALVAALGPGNRDVPRLGEVTFDDQPGEVWVRWAIDDNLTEGMIKGSAKHDAAKILRALATSGLDYQTIVMNGSFPMGDAYGKVTEDNVVNLTFYKATVDRIVWDNFDTDNIYVIADEAVIWPAFRD